jgi:hypothetical protein
VREESSCDRGNHTVQDRYVARRLAEEAAARAEADRRFAEENTSSAGEEGEDSAVGLSLALGVLVAALLLAVIWFSGSR